jgi:hypothetical protein
MDKRVLTLLFTYPKKAYLPSKIIKARLGTDYSHVCGVVFTGPIGLFDLYEASHGNVHDIDLGEFLKKNKVIKTCRLTVDKEDLYKVIRYLKKQRGKDYSEWGAIASTVPFLRALGLGNNNDQSFMCSEYMARALEQIDAIDYSGIRCDADYVDPKSFERALQKMGLDFYEGLHLPEFTGL